MGSPMEKRTILFYLNSCYPGRWVTQWRREPPGSRGSRESVRPTRWQPAAVAATPDPSCKKMYNLVNKNYTIINNKIWVHKKKTIFVGNLKLCLDYQKGRQFRKKVFLAFFGSGYVDPVQKICLELMQHWLLQLYVIKWNLKYVIYSTGGKTEKHNLAIESGTSVKAKIWMKQIVASDRVLRYRWRKVLGRRKC